MGLTRRTAVAAGVVASVLGGGLLFATAPPSNLRDVPAYALDAEAEEPIRNVNIIPELTEFYDVAGVPPGPPGQFVRAEEIEGAPDGIRLFRIMYQSTDLKDNPLPVTAMFAVPDTEPPPGGFPLVGFAHGTLGVGQVCGPSHSPLLPYSPGYTGWPTHVEPLVKEGWAVVASDYSGMGAPGPSSYLIGPLEGRGILDSMRAVLESRPETGNVPIDQDKLALYGKSQGGEAVLAALEIREDYAPDLDAIAGGVALAPGYAVPIRAALDYVAENPTSAAQTMFTLLIVKSIADNYPDLITLDEALTDEGMRRLELLDTHCSSQLTEALSDVELSDLLELPLAEGVVTGLTEASLGREPLGRPVMIVQGLEDVTILPQFTHAQALLRCAQGDTVYYVRFSEDNHPTLNYQARLTDPTALDWIRDRWAGEPAPSNCPNQLLGTFSTAAGVK